MITAALKWNLISAWILILLGFASGALMGLKFQKENWLGGYASLKRRMYRLGHISFFGLGTLNLLFYWTAQPLTWNAGLQLSSVLFIAGGVTMPICCVLMAHWPKAQFFFGIPVISLIAGGFSLLIQIIKL